MIAKISGTACGLVTLGCLVAAAAPAQAQNSRQLEEVIVTATKREQSLQDVAASVSAMSGDALVNEQITNVMDLGAALPNVSIGDTLGVAQITIRGLGLDSFFLGGEPSVAMHVDGAVISRGEAQMGSFFDLQRVEVVRGPSGTLFGRNATGGSLNLITNKPTDTLEGYARGTYGNYDYVQLDAAVSGPITDSLLGRVAYQGAQRNGYGTDWYTGTEINNAQRQAGRAQLQYLFTDTADFTLSGEYAEEHDHNFATSPLDRMYPDAAPGPFSSPSAFVGDRDISSDNKGRNQRKTWSITGTLNWELNESTAFKSITNYRDFESEPSTDIFFNPTPAATANNYLNYDQFSQEFQLNYTNDRMVVVGGLYYFYESFEADGSICALVASACNDYKDVGLSVPPPPGFLLVQQGKSETESYAAYANLNYKLTDTLSLIAGARYSYEDRSGENTAVFNVNIPNAQTGKQDEDLDKFNPELGIEWHPNDNTMLYATYKTAYKAGVFYAGNNLPETGEVYPILDPETVEGYEVGLKSSLFENTMDLSLAAFYQELKDKQVSRSIPVGSSQIALLENAAGADIYGVEMELTWLATEHLTVLASGGYLDAEFTDFETANTLEFDQPGGNRIQNAEGNQLPLSPEWSGRLRLEYDMELGGVKGVLGVEAQYKDESQAFAFPSEQTTIDSYTAYMANLLITTEDGAWSANIWGRNLTDETYFNSKLVASGCRCIAGIAAAPRTYGVTLGYNF